MTHPHVNPFEDGPAQAEGKMAFGTLRLFTEKVNLVKGAEYIMTDLGIDPDKDSPLNCLTDKSGNYWAFRGKQKTANGSHTHVIPVITRRASDGRLYNDFRDFMYWQNDVCQRVTIPSLQAHFGAKLAGIWNKSVEVQAEIVEIPDGQYTRQAFKVVKVFKTKEEREQAEQAFFAQFHQSGAEVAEDIPGFDPEGVDAPVPWEADYKPVGMAKEAAVALLPTLWAASGQDKDKFLDQLRGMPVLLAALDVHERALGTSPEIVAHYAKNELRDLWNRIQQDNEVEDKKDEFLYQLSHKEVLLQALGGVDAPEIVAIYS